MENYISIIDTAFNQKEKEKKKCFIFSGKELSFKKRYGWMYISQMRWGKKKALQDSSSWGFGFQQMPL